jgi:hypothetical protein
MRLHTPVHHTRQPHLMGIPHYDDGGEVDPTQFLGDQSSSDNSGGDYGGGSGDQSDQSAADNQGGNKGSSSGETGDTLAGGSGMDDPSVLSDIASANAAYQYSQDAVQSLHEGNTQTAMDTSGMRPSQNIEDNRGGAGSIDVGQPQSKTNANQQAPNINSGGDGMPQPYPYNGSGKILGEPQQQGAIPTDQDQDIG